MRYVVRPVASLQELAQVFDLAGAQLPQPLTRQDRRLAELGRRLLEEVEAAAVRLGALEISLGASGPERGFYLHMGYAGRARLRKQLPLSGAAAPWAEERRHHLEELRRRRRWRLAGRQP